MKEKFYYLFYLLSCVPHRSSPYNRIEMSFTLMGFAFSFIGMGLIMGIFICCKLLVLYGFFSLSFFKDARYVSVGVSVINLICFIIISFYFDFRFSDNEKWEVIRKRYLNMGSSPMDDYWKGVGILIGSLLFFLLACYISAPIPLVV
jgi:uncharacterized protein YacL